MQINEAIFDGLIRTGAILDAFNDAIVLARKERNYNRADLLQNQRGQLADIFATAGRR